MIMVGRLGRERYEENTVGMTCVFGRGLGFIWYRLLLLMDFLSSLGTLEPMMMTVT